MFPISITVPPAVVRYVVQSLKFILIGVVVVCVATPLHADSANGISVRQAWSRATPPGIEVGVAYLVIENHGAPDRLVSAASPIAKHTELHISKMEDGIMKMLPLKTVDIKPGAQTAFAPGGRHVMLIGLKQSLKDGDTFPLTLTFEHTGPVLTTVHVYGIGKTPPQR